MTRKRKVSEMHDDVKNIQERKISHAEIMENIVSDVQADDIAKYQLLYTTILHLRKQRVENTLQADKEMMQADMDKKNFDYAHMVRMNEILKQNTEYLEKTKEYYDYFRTYTYNTQT